MIFSDLEWKQHSLGPSGMQAVVLFPNGYGLSVVRFEYSHGGEFGLFEVAVIRGTLENYELDNTTSLTSDVIGWVGDNGINKLLKKVEALPKRGQKGNSLPELLPKGPVRKKPNC